MSQEEVMYYTIRDVILTCARKPTSVSLIYRTEPTTKKCKTEKKLKSKKRKYIGYIGTGKGESEVEKLVRGGLISGIGYTRLKGTFSYSKRG